MRSKVCMWNKEDIIAEYRCSSNTSIVILEIYGDSVLVGHYSLNTNIIDDVEKCYFYYRQSVDKWCFDYDYTTFTLDDFVMID